MQLFDPGHLSALIPKRTKCFPQQHIRMVLRVMLMAVVLAATAILTPAAQADEGVHVVQRGENLSTIAQRYNVGMGDLASNNGIANLNIVHVGQRLVIPGSAAASLYSRPADLSLLPGTEGYFTVARGQTLAQIAQQHNMTASDLMRMNGLSNPNFVWAGQKLRVTARVAPAAFDEAHQTEPALADNIHIVQIGETIADIAKTYDTTTHSLMWANGLPNANFLWVGQRLRVSADNAPKAPDPTLMVKQAPADGYRYIEVNLSNQTLTAWQGDVPVLHTNVSTGTSATPTVTGRFPVYLKYSSQHMSGPGYSLPGVPWVMYFFSGYAIHGTYWHNNFGTPMSHGCVNMRTNEAEFLYGWASEGTEVYVHY